MDISLAKLRENANTTPRKITLDLCELALTEPGPDFYPRFIAVVEEALDYVAQTLSRNPEMHRDQSEDQITYLVLTQLKALCFDVTHDQKIGGHCDLTIETKFENLWLGEAKKLDRINNNYAFKGFEQLNTRYSTGSMNQTHGGLLFYCFLPRTDKFLASWKKYLAAKVKNISIKSCPKNPISALVSSHRHHRTGAPFIIRHLAISLFFDPQDT